MDELNKETIEKIDEAKERIASGDFVSENEAEKRLKFDEFDSGKSTAQLDSKVRKHRVRGQREKIIELLKENPSLDNKAVFESLQNNSFKDRVLKFKSVCSTIAQVKKSLKVEPKDG